MKSVYLSWKSTGIEKWTPVAKLSRSNGLYKLNYTKGASKTNLFTGFPMMTDLSKFYSSEELFPSFSNRLLSKSRPEFTKYLRWLNMTSESYEPIDMLAVSGGERGTDDIKVIPSPEMSSNLFIVEFFLQGIGHLNSGVKGRLEKLAGGEQLFLLNDVQNEFDPNAVVARTSEPKCMVGYIPGYLSEEVSRILCDYQPSVADLSVVKVNLDAPPQFQLLVKLTVSLKKSEIKLFSSSDYEDYSV